MKQRETNQLSKKLRLDSVEIGDYIRSSTLKKWMKITDIQNIDGAYFLIGEELISNEILAFTDDDCTMSWNPEISNYGR